MFIPIIVFLALLMSTMGTFAGTDPCKTRICRKDYSYDGRRCESEPDPFTQARSHYSPPQPICNSGWHIDGQYCVKDNCCFVSPCRGDEKYEDGLCKSGPTFFGYRTHRTATCPNGWTLLRASGWCQKNGCNDRLQPPPPAVAADTTDEPPHTHSRRDTPPPPAVEASRSGEPPVVTGYSSGPCVDRGGRVTIEGRNFGGVQGTRIVELGGHGIGIVLQVVRWSSRAIIVTIPNNPRIEQGQWYYIGIQDRDRHWLSNIDKHITICRGLE